MRRCLETDCRVVWKLSAMTLGVIACTAIKVIIARLVGSAMAWKMSRLISFDFMRNRLAANISATIWFRKIFFKRKMWVGLALVWLWLGPYKSRGSNPVFPTY